MEINETNRASFFPFQGRIVRQAFRIVCPQISLNFETNTPSSLSLLIFFYQETFFQRGLYIHLEESICVNDRGELWIDFVDR